MPDKESEARWYVVHTYSGYENKVALDLSITVENRNLKDRIQEIKVPTEKVVEIKDNKSKEVERKIFPGYVLVKMIMTDDMRHVVRNIRGCTGFVGPDSTSDPIPLSDEEVKRLGVETRSVELEYSVNDTVRIIDGSFDGLIGVVESIDMENNNVRVIIRMFNRETPVDLNLDQVEILE